MITIKVHTPIASEGEGIFYSMMGVENAVFSLDTCQRIFEEHPEETDFRFNLHCPGGSVTEGLAIYDFLRTSGKNIHMNIEGDCHSMAVTLLLAAPKENRTASPNCSALIHRPSCTNVPDSTADGLEKAATLVRQLQDRILDIYADRTSLPRERLAEIMDEDRVRSAKELLEWGFIGRINAYITNFKPNNPFIMNIKQLKQKATDFLNSIKDVLRVVNFDFVDAEGAVLFSTEAEDDRLEVGMPATPDGTFTIADGRVVTISEGVITEIEDPEPEPGPESDAENLRAENLNLRNQLAQAGDLIRELKGALKSNYTPSGRFGSPGKTGRPANSGPSRKDDIRARLGKSKSNQ